MPKGVSQRLLKIVNDKMDQCNKNYSNDCSEDQSHLSKPINIGVSGAQQIIRCIHGGTTEVRDLLLNECEVIYECRVCRSLFRSLANFVIHKREYCKTHLCESMTLFSAEDFPEETVIVQPESPKDSEENGVEADVFVSENGQNNEEEEPESLSIITSSPKIFKQESKPLPRKQTEASEPSVSSKERHSRAVTLYTNRIKELEQKKAAAKPPSLIKLTAINGNSNAVFQTLSHSFDGTVSTTKKADEQKHSDNSESSSESNSSSDSTRQRHDSDGTTVIISRLKKRPDCDIKKIMCLKCKTQYTSLKTLDFHMRSIHAEKRVYYPCLFCKTSFVQLWGVTRHIISVHKKSKEQVNKLRETLKRKAYSKPLNAPEKQLKHAPPNPPNNNKSKFNKKALIYSCRKCGRMFATKPSQISHQKFCSATKGKIPDKTVTIKKKAKPVSNDVKRETEDHKRPKRNAKKKERKDFIDFSSIYKRVTKVNKPGSSAKKPGSSTIEKRVLEIMNTSKLYCLKCNRKFSTFSNLRRHAAIHVGWNRFKCKYCEYQSYNRSDCRNHIQRVHLAGKTTKNSLGYLDKLVIDLPSQNIPAKKDKSSSPQSKSSQSKKSTNDQTTYSSNQSASSKSAKSPATLTNHSSAARSHSDSGSKFSSSSSLTHTKQMNSDSWSSSRHSLPGTLTSSSSLQCTLGTSTRISPRRYDYLPKSGDSMLTLVTRSGMYPKADLFNKYIQKKYSNDKSSKEKPGDESNPSDENDSGKETEEKSKSNSLEQSTKLIVYCDTEQGTA